MTTLPADSAATEPPVTARATPGSGTAVPGPPTVAGPAGADVAGPDSAGAGPAGAEPAARRAGSPPADEPPVTPADALAEDAALDVLRHGVLELEGRLIDASNTTLRGFSTLAGVRVRCVYKPVRGERPLRDFPAGTLARRELAAYLVSAAGSGVVPPTVLRDGPLGRGACQLWVDEDEAAPPVLGFVPAGALPVGWFPILSARDESGTSYVLAHADDPRLARLAVFDAVTNNADRKGGHVLLAPRGRVYGVDHGISFHTDDKLRTVLWGWAGRPLPDAELDLLRGLAEALAGVLGATLADHLSRAELRATGRRTAGLLETGRFPQPAADRHAVPWPPV